MAVKFSTSNATAHATDHYQQNALWTYAFETHRIRNDDKTTHLVAVHVIIITLQQKKTEQYKFG